MSACAMARGGRGGTVLQPALTRLEEDERFPKDVPILVITDGACDQRSCRREPACPSAPPHRSSGSSGRRRGERQP
jgi:hypothetical protein